ncbi:C2orf69 [Popillia japonica]|uniref:C2orf69 n=1 Tax=Popillia japonica TaxID=7064 RepID=A0AAW1IW79_POPJA
MLGSPAPPSPIRLYAVTGYEGRANDIIYCHPALRSEKQSTVIYFGGDMQDEFLLLRRSHILDTNPTEYDCALILIRSNREGCEKAKEKSDEDAKVRVNKRMIQGSARDGVAHSSNSDCGRATCHYSGLPVQPVRFPPGEKPN